jgi:hypothetical protein
MTVHEDAAEALLQDIQLDEKATSAMLRLRNRHVQGDMDEGGILGTGYADSLGSSARYAPNKWPLHQHAAFVQIHALIGAGDVAYTCISTGGTPGPDADRAGNARKLEDTLNPFQAELDMHQNGADSDGVVWWDEPLKISRSTGAHFFPSACRKETYSLITYPTMRDPGSAPLEVGDSWPSRTLLHLWEDGAVARWPYGSKLIWLFINYKRFSL